VRISASFAPISEDRTTAILVCFIVVGESIKVVGHEQHDDHNKVHDNSRATSKVIMRTA
jgi:hypothetical protein